MKDLGGLWRRKGRREEETYIAQISHDIKEKLRLLEIVTHLLNRLPNHQILGNLGPHRFLLWFHSNEPPTHIQSSLLHNLLLPSIVLLRDELATPYTIIPLPSDLLARATDAVELDAAGPWRDVDNCPVSGGAVVGFADVSALRITAGIVVGFFGNGVVAGAAVAAGRAAAAGGPTTEGAIVGGFAAGVNDDVVVVAVAVVFASVVR